MSIKYGLIDIADIPGIRKVYSGEKMVWSKSLKLSEISISKISDGYFKATTEPGANYRVILSGYDAFDIGTCKYGTDIRNSTVKSNEIVFTAKTTETFFRIYGSDIKIISIAKIEAGSDLNKTIYTLDAKRYALKNGIPIPIQVYEEIKNKKITKIKVGDLTSIDNSYIAYVYKNKDANDCTIHFTTEFGALPIGEKSIPAGTQVTIWYE